MPKKQIEFKTFEEQLDRLINEKNLKVRNIENAIYVLKNNSYYGLINGYKSFFSSKKIINGQEVDDFKGNYFEDILYLYDFDRELSSILFKYLRILEDGVKTIISHKIAEEFSVDESVYLNPIYYREGDLISSNELTIDISSGVIKRGQFQRDKFLKQMNELILSKKFDSIRHYHTNYECVPPWILIRHCTFTETAYWYQLLKEGCVVQIESTEVSDPVQNNGLYAKQNEDVKLEIVKHFLDVKVDVNRSDLIAQVDRYKSTFLDSLFILAEYRNVIAHGSPIISRTSKGDRHLKKYLRSILQNSELLEIHGQSKSYVFSACLALRVMFSKRSTVKENFIVEVINLLKRLKDDHPEIYLQVSYKTKMSIENLEKLKVI